MTFSPRVFTGAVAACVLGTAVPAVAQREDACALRQTHPSTTTFAPATSSLPVDRVNNLLVLAPGVTTTDDGQLNVRNGGPGGNGLYVDGVPVMPGVRNGFSPSLGGSYVKIGGPGVGIGTNGFRQLSLTAGLTPLDRGNVLGGVIDVETAPCADETPAPAVLTAGLASDAMFGTSNGLGYNRFTVGGLARAGRLEFGGGIVIEGQKSDRLGLKQNDSPVYVQDGIDTTVTFDLDGNDTTVAVDRFRASDGIRIPRSAQSSYTLSGQASYYLGTRHRIQVSGLASQLQGRLFDYENLYNSRQAFGSRNWSQVLTASWFGQLLEQGNMRLSAEAHASLQWDHATEAPLSSSGEQDSRDPSLGLLLSPLDFRFSQSNFAVNDQLIDNFRTNTGRRSPYDLDNTIQYELVDRYRNNAYGVLGFSEAGGPIGTLSFYDERRTVGTGIVTAEFRGLHRLRVGVEATRYEAKLYTSQLTSQSFAEAFIEKPTSQAVFGEYRLALPSVTVTGGLRYDRFNSGASRTEFPRISSLPGSEFIEDEAHSRVSPRASFVYHGTPRVRVFGGYTALAQAPDLRLLYAGINTDLSTTNINQPYGTDLDFERSSLLEGGAEYLLDSSTTIAGTVWSRSDKDRVVLQLSSELDPFRGSNVDIRRYRNAIDASTAGFDARLTRALATNGQAWLSYGFISPDDGSNARYQQRYLRKHTVSAALLYQTGPDNRALAGLLRNTGVYATFRYATGTAYTACPVDVPEDVGVLSSEGICNRNIEGDFLGEHLPSLKTFDLRVSRGFSVGGAELSAFADARNLFNLRTITQVFAQSRDIVNGRELETFRAGQASEFANEGSINGALLGDNSLDLSFGGAADPRSACGNWTTAGGTGAAPNCVYLINAEQRFGNGDHIFTPDEQTRAIDAYYNVARGEQNFTAPGRRVRIGLELRF